MRHPTHTVHMCAVVSSTRQNLLGWVRSCQGLKPDTLKRDLVHPCSFPQVPAESSSNVSVGPQLSHLLMLPSSHVSTSACQQPVTTNSGYECGQCDRDHDESRALLTADSQPEWPLSQCHTRGLCLQPVCPSCLLSQDLGGPWCQCGRFLVDSDHVEVSFACGLCCAESA